MNWHNSILLSGFMLACLFFHTPAISQTTTDSIIITKRFLSVEDGLASREVFCAIQDDEGFMWFGTRNGLNRYDGKNTKLFTKQKNGLAENKIIQLAKDNSNQLFIVYGSPGFARSAMRIEVMDLSTNKVKSLKETFPGMPFKEEDVYWVANGGNDLCFLVAHPFQYWRLTKNGFKLMGEMKAWDEPGPKDENGRTAIENNYTTTGPFSQFNKDRALLSLGYNTPNYFFTSTKTEKVSSQDGMLINQNKQLTHSWQDVYRKLNPEVTRNKKPLPTIAASYQQGAIYFLSGDYSNSLVYRAKDGLFLYDFTSLHKLLNPGDLKIPSGYGLYSYFIDRQNNIWVCTAGGLIKIKREKNRFTHYFTKQQLKDSSDNQVRGIYAHVNGDVYAAAWNKLWYSRANENQFAKIGLDNIMYAVSRYQDAVYVGEANLYQFNAQIKNGLQKLTDGNLGEIWSLDSLSPGKLIVGCTEALLTYNIASHEFTKLFYSTSIPKAQFVYRFIRRKDKKIWAVAQNGLYLLNAKADSVTSYFGNASRQPDNRLPFDIIMDAFEDEAGVIWFATNGSGLYRWDRSKHEFKQFNTTDGLPSDILYRIESDDYNNLWISTDNGIVRFNTEDFKTTSFTTFGGITHNEFNRASSFKASDGRLFFGGLDGVNAFYPKEFVSDTGSSTLPLRIISFNKFSEKEDQIIDQTSELLALNKITLLPGDRFFNIEFQLLDFEEGPLNYAYMIEGVDKDWNYINENSIRISGLPYGEYTLQVKGQAHNGQWSKSELLIPLLVVRPFYMRWWFIVLAGMGLVLLINMLYKQRVRQLINAKLMLEQEVLQRTTDLKDSLAQEQALLQEKDVLLKEIHHRVKNNLQVISGLLELQEKTLSDEQAKQALQEGRNRVRSIALIHQNLYQYENLSQIEVRSFITDLYEQVSSMFQHIANHTTANINLPVMEIDIDTAVPFGLALNELLTNSFKYGHVSGSVFKIDMSLVAENHGGAEGKRFIFVYKDSGPGLPAGFDVARSKSLGMRLINDLSKQMGGKMQYSFDNGSSFTIIFYNKIARKLKD